MREMSFAMLPGIGAVREQRIWESGVRSWETFLEIEKIPGISKKRKRYLDAVLRQGISQGAEPGFLSDYFPNNLHWRVYEDLREDAAYLDIETNGLSRYSSITVIGIHRRKGSRWISLVKGMGLTSATLREAVEGVSMFVTYNGASFDLPFIRSRFSGCLPDVPHFDLRFAAHRLGYPGGLKRLEHHLGINRDFEVTNLAGEDALIYWKMWERDRNRKALRLLRKYNREDVENLIPIADRLYSEMVEHTIGRIEGTTCDDEGNQSEKTPPQSEVHRSA
jgi:uncharacterized protein